MIEAEPAALPPKSHEIWGFIGLFSLSSYLLRTVLGYVAVSMDHETPGSNSDNSRKAIILSTFFMGYASNNVLAGVAASRYGGMTVLHFACIGWSVCGMLIPSVFDVSGGNATSVGLVMFFLGVCCAPMWPASQAVLSFFSTPTTISLGASIRAAGAHGGSIIATFATPMLLSALGWRALLQVYGALGLMIVTISMIFGPAGGNQMNKSSSQPASAAADSAESLIDTETESTSPEEALVFDKAMITSFLSRFLDDSAEFKILCESSVLSAFGSHMATNLANFTLLSYMPTYFVDVLHLNLADTAPYLVPSRFSMLLGVVISGQASRYVLNHQLLTLTQTRRDGACLCMMGTALALFALPLTTSPAGAALCLGCSTFFIGSFEVFLQSTYIDLCADTPQYAGFVCGSGNTLAALPGALGPFFVSQMLTHFDSWVLVFWVMSFFLVGATVTHSIYGSTASISLDKKYKL